ncbi:MAG: hypothetical protein OXT70_03545 [Chloroflexota bacterium]|nr:hypothetical protein [Chloroflexota bacterium]
MIKGFRGSIGWRWRRVRDWESRSETWLYPFFETPIWLLGLFTWGYMILGLTWDPPADADSSNLGSVLEAQAGMTAIFLAAMVFIVEAVHRRQDLDDPLYEEFLSRSQARWVFSVAVWLTVGTSLLYAIGPVTGWLDRANGPLGDLLGLSSLIIAAVIALAFLLRALHVLRPEQYRRLRREVTLKQVSEGARAFTADLGTLDGQLRQSVGIINDPERAANRTIDRLIERTYQAVSTDRIIDIREGFDLVDEVCAEILSELDDAEYQFPPIGDLQDRRWPTHNAIIAGINRLVRAAKERPTADALDEIWRAEPSRSRPPSFRELRLSESIRKRNELLVQVLLETLLAELHQRNAGEPVSRSRPRIDMADTLKRAVWAAYNVSESERTDPRRIRIAARVMYTVHEVASYSAFLDDGSAVEDGVDFFLSYILSEHAAKEESNSYGIVGPSLPASMRSRGRQAAFGLIGYAVAKPMHDLLRKVSKRFGSLDVALLSLDSFEADAAERYGIDSPLGQPRVWMTFAAFGPKEENVVEARSLRFVVLGYMWVLAMTRGVGGKECVWPEMPAEYREAWAANGAKLVNAMVGCGWGNWQDARDWCERAFDSEAS